MNILQRLSPKLPKSASDEGGLGGGMAILPSDQRTIPFTVPSSSTRTRHSGMMRSPYHSKQDLASLDASSLPPSASNSTSLCEADTPDVTLHTTPTRGAFALGTIDPTLYKVNDDDELDYEPPEHHIGRVWFAVKYERESEKLLVTVIRSRNLPSRSLSANNCCDPFFRIYLMPDERRYLQSKFKKKTCNPKFEETFVFQVSNKALDDRVLKLTFYDIDRQKRHLVIGHALYPLREHNYDSNERVVIWRNLERESVENVLELSELHVALCYNDSMERLTVTVFQAKGVANEDDATYPDHYVKVCLMHQGKVMKTKRSETVKKSCQPVFNELFQFKLTSDNADMASVSITLIQHSSGIKDKCLGRIVLGSFMFARGKELDHWTEMMSEPKARVDHWHTLA